MGTSCEKVLITRGDCLYFYILRENWNTTTRTCYVYREIINWKILQPLCFLTAEYCLLHLLLLPGRKALILSAKFNRNTIRYNPIRQEYNTRNITLTRFFVDIFLNLWEIYNLCFLHVTCLVRYKMFYNANKVSWHFISHNDSWFAIFG